MTIVKADRYAGTHRLDSSRELAQMVFREDGHEEDIALVAAGLKQALSDKRGAGILDVQLPEETEPRKVIIRKIVRASDGLRLDHVVLREVSDTDVIRTKVPVVAKGLMPSPAGTQIRLVQSCSNVELVGPVSALDHPVQVDVSRLGPDDRLCAGDLPLPEGARLCSDIQQEIFRLTTIARA